MLYSEYRKMHDPTQLWTWNRRKKLLGELLWWVCVVAFVAALGWWIVWGPR